MQRKAGKVTVEPGKPLRFQADDSPEAQPSSEGSPSTLGRTFKAYWSSLKQLLATRYAHAADAAPAYMKGPCQVTVILCTDALMVRYDVVENDDVAKVRVVDAAQPIEKVAPIFSDSVLHAPCDRTKWNPSFDGPKCSLFIGDPTGQASRDVVTFGPMIVMSTKWPEGVKCPDPPSRPAPVVSLINEFDFEMHGYVEDATPAAPREIRDENTHFTVRSRIVLPTGWCAIEVYPLLNESHWLPEAAPQWAEIDLLFALLQRNSRNQDLAALDGRVAKRREVSAMLTEFESLLAGAEEPVHQFLKKNPILLFPTYDRIWSKVPFGQHVSDFVVREVPGDYILVEIEAPHRELFRQDGHPRHQFTHAIDQINDWLTHLADHRAEMEAKYDMHGMSANPRGLVVIGRSHGLTEDNKRKLATIQERQPRLRIMTYDDVISNARAIFEKVLGPLSFVVSGAQVYFHGPKQQ